MKTFIPLILLCILCINTASAVDAKRFAWEQGSVTYDVSGACTGTEILKWKDFGRRKALYATNKLNLLGFTQETRTLMLSKGANEYSVNLKDKNGTLKTNKVLDELYATNDTEETISKHLLIQQGAKEVGNKNILGMQCIEWQIKRNRSTTTTCLTEDGIPLEIISSVAGGSHHSLAVAVNREPVSDAEVSLPKDIIIQTEGSADNKLVKALKKTQQSKETLNCLAHDKDKASSTLITK